MDKIISQIEKIREINNQNKLVIFVGAGVSKNSGVCSWWELVRDIAIKIGYDDICEKCPQKYEYHSECGDGDEYCSSNSKCYWKYNFSAEEFIKIPQYFVDIKGENEYFDFLKNKFGKTYIPNEIDELIIKLNPEHIITTNYDHLLEDTFHPNIGNYTVIKSDKDLLEKNGRRYIIKMHGDTDEIKEIVLKEDDYLKYSQKHILIETYIKSLLIDKTFLFVGYSLNDNNLSLIMSYIDYFVKDKEVEKRSSHYLVVNNVSNSERQIPYWKNRGVELVDLSRLNIDMKNNAKCDSLKSEQGRSLFTFLKYLYDDKLPYSDNRRIALEKSLLNTFQQFDDFNFVSYTHLLKACQFLTPVRVIDSALYFTDKGEYELLKSIFMEQNDTSEKIKQTFIKAGICGIRFRGRVVDSYDFENYCYAEDQLFEMSLKNQYKEIIDIVDRSNNELERAYYYSLIYRTGDKLMGIMCEIEKQIKKFDYQNLSIKEKLIMATFEYNIISLRLLNYNSDNKERWSRLNDLLDSASYQSAAFETIKKLSEDNGDILNTLNNYLIKHEVYYMKKSTTTKWGGTKYGDLFDLQSVVYGYYKFYKKNYLMLDWFNNAEKICEPYIKAILCTYYPDEYQFSNNALGRTEVAPYPINLIDIDMIVKHTKFKNFVNWIIYYKVFRITIDDSVDIAEIFENFCISMRNYWNRFFDEQLKVFAKLITLIELTHNQKQRILNAFITLIKQEDVVSVGMLRNNLNAIWLYVQKHYDNEDSNFYTLLSILVNEQLIKDTFDGKEAYENLIEKLSVHADKKIYDVCTEMITKNQSSREKCYFAFVYRNILIKFDDNYWQEWIKKNISDNWVQEIYAYIEDGTLVFDDEVKSYFNKKIAKYKNQKSAGLYSSPDHQKEAINYLLILLLTEHIPSLGDIEFLRQYTEDSDYLDFLFNPDTFDYSKITTADYMWCNFINIDNYRSLILGHKNEFWNEDDEKRIALGFGNDYENRVAYKFLFD